VGSDDNNIYALNATDGIKLWSYPTGGAVDSSPAVANGITYVGSEDGNVYALGDLSASSNNLPIIIGEIAAILIVAAVVFLMFKKRLKTKPTILQSAQQNST
jgi:hypothetical protein